MSLGETLEVVVTALHRAGIDHMVAGSVASTAYGEPRSTQNVDLVIDPSSVEALTRFVDQLDRDRYYVGDAITALSERSMFNVIDTGTGWKVDLIIRRNRPFSRSEMARRRPATIEGIEVDLASPEDIVLTKLEWARLGGSERQLRDVVAVIRAGVGRLDLDYLRRWAIELGVQDELERALTEAG